jgi:hypothetical protein
LSQVNEQLQKSQLYLSHLICDDQIFYEDFEEYIRDNIETVSEIQVKAVTATQLAKQTILTLESHLVEAIPEMKRIADDFYKQPDQDTWLQLNQVLESIQWVEQTCQHTSKILNETSGLSFDVSHLFHRKEILESLLEAMNNKDTVLIGDLINYELTPLLESIQQTIIKVIDIGVVRNDLN